MKTNSKALKLIEMGLSANTVGKLSESQLKLLYGKFMLDEQSQPVVRTKTVKQIEIPSGSETSVGGVSVANKAGKTVVTTTAEGEMSEDKVDPMNVFSGETTQQPHQVGASTDMGDPSGAVDGMPTEGELGEKKKEYNPFAICTSTMGKEFGTTERSEWSKSEMNKYERCVKDVKKSVKEGKNPYHLLIEKEIVSLVERNLTPKMTKKDFIKTIFEAPTEAPTKPKVKPGVKPDTKPQRPPHPGKNPNPGENPAPKAQDLERAKEDVLNAIKSLLSNGKK
jgi:hypothetical protein